MSVSCTGEPIMSGAMARAARAHRDPSFLAAQRARLSAPPVGTLNKLVAELERSTGHVVPRFDPSSGGVDATALLLLESPGPASTRARGSGIISVHNDDVTAAHVHELLTSHDIAVDSVLVWNVVPWWLPDEANTGSFRAPRSQDLRAAAPWLERVLALLPELRVIVTLGRKAEQGLETYEATRPLPYTVISGPHPGGQAWNRPHLRHATEQAFATLATLLHTPIVSNRPERRSFWP